MSGRACRQMAAPALLLVTCIGRSAGVYADAAAADVVLVDHVHLLRDCTRRGALVGARLPDGRLWGVLGDGTTLVGLEDAVSVYREDGAALARRLAADEAPTPLWTGPYSALAPTPVGRLAGVALSDSGRDLKAVRLGDADRIADHLLRTATPVSCSPGGPSVLYVGAWADAIELASGAIVVDASPFAVQVRSERGVAFYGYLAAPSARAEGLAAELALAWPEAATAVAWKAAPQTGLVFVVSTDPLQGLPAVSRVAPGELPEARLLPHLPLPRIPVRAALPPIVGTEAAPAWPVHAPGEEMVHYLNEVRARVGLAPATVTPVLDLVALGHCGWLEYDLGAGGTGGGHIQDPASPVFTGASPHDRGADTEVLFRHDGLAWESMEGWLATPFHRIYPLHPQVAEGGGCATRGGARVVNMNLDYTVAKPAIQVFPTDGMRDVPLLFSGLEVPDPLPPSIAPDLRLPVGYTLTVWLDAPGAEVDLVRSWIEAPAGKVPHYVIHPDNHESLASSSIATVHLMAHRPFDPGTTYTWGIEARVQGQLQRVEAHFRTTDDGRGRHPTPTATGQRVMNQSNAIRRRAGLPELSWLAQGAVLAEVFSVNQSYEDIKPITPPGPRFALCRSVDELRALAAGDRHPGWLEQQLRFMQRAEYSGMGEAIVGDQHCIAWFADAVVQQAR